MLFCARNLGVTKMLLSTTRAVLTILKFALALQPIVLEIDGAVACRRPTAPPSRYDASNPNSPYSSAFGRNLNSRQRHAARWAAASTREKLMRRGDHPRNLQRKAHGGPRPGHRTDVDCSAMLGSSDTN